MPSPLARRVVAVAAASAASAFATACQDLSSYSTTSTKQYIGCVVPAEFVLAGVSSTTELCLTLDATHLEDAPGTLSSSDGRFQSTPLRPIPQLWNDPLSTFTFGEGRTKNLLYMAAPSTDAAGGAGDVTVVLSLMSGGGVEVRFLRGAPAVVSDAAGPASAAGNVFAVFPLVLKKRTDCSALSASHCMLDAGTGDGATEP
jgi:hypothetical protein